jgi:fructokinase
MRASIDPMRIGIDLGGTKIEGIALAADGSVPVRERIATPRERYEDVIEAIAGLVARIEAQVGPCTVGVGTPGSISPKTGLLRGSNTVMLNGHPLDRDLSARLAREVRIANDANCFALSEASDGAAGGARVVFGVIVGTGCGAGIVVDGRALVGRHGIAGEWGHNPLPWPESDELPGPPCYCGKRGCIETWLSGPAIQRDHFERTRDLLDARQIAERAASGDAAAFATLERLASRMARSLATIIDVLDPDVIVLGGGVGNIASLYDDVPRLLPEWVFSDYVEPRIVPPMHGDSSGVRGAAWLWPT